MKTDTTQITIHDARVTVNKEVAEGIWRMVLLVPELANVLKPGQFITIAVPGNPAHLTRVPLSPSRADSDAGTVEVFYAAIGDATRRLSTIEGGCFLSVVGPCGSGWKVPDKNGRCLLVAGGIGAPPIFSAARMLVSLGHDCDVILAARSARKLWGVETLEELGVQYVLVTDDGTAGVRGLATAVVPSLLAAHRYSAIYTCGPAPMLAGVATSARAANIACQVSLERMMTCGFGACSTCNVKLAKGGYALCCTDGPVFNAQEVAF